MLVIAPRCLGRCRSANSRYDTGIVVDERGSPVASAEVLATGTIVRGAGTGVLQYHQTDMDGRFIIQNLPWDKYRVSAKKEDEGYPGPLFGLYPAQSQFIQLVTLQPVSPIAHLTVHLPPKGGAIESISVVDAVTGREMNTAAITLRRAEEPAIFVETSTMLKPILVPSNTDVSIEISAPGYKPWPGKGEVMKAARIRLSPEQGVNLQVKLAPDGSNANGVTLFSPAPYAPARNTARPEPKSSNPILSKAVEPFNVTADDISVPLEKLARQYGVPIGFEAMPRGAGTQKTASVRIEVESGTVRDVLNAIIAADPAYKWKEADLGTINVLPKAHTDSLLDVVVSTYSYQVTGADDGINDLMRAPEVQGWMARERVERHVPSVAMSPASVATGGHVRWNNASVRTLLNALLMFSDSHYWIYSRAGDHNELVVLSTGN